MLSVPNPPAALAVSIQNPAMQRSVTVPLLLCLVFAAFVAMPAPRARARQPRDAEIVTPESLTDLEIGWAIDAIRDGLYTRQNNAGTWEFGSNDPALMHLATHLTGQTTIAVYALLVSGQSYQEPRLQPAIDFLRAQKPDYTYVRSLRAHIWALLPERFGPLLEDDRTWLLRAYGYDAGSWAYTSIPMESGYDNSLTQYGLLGLWEAAKRNHEIPDRIWKRIEDHYLRTQMADGGWNYRPQFGESRGSMTAAGLTCLFVTQDFLHAEKFVRPGLKDTDQQRAINRGLDWFDQNFAVDRHPGLTIEAAQTYLFYYLYGMERVGLASGYKRFGRHDWFRAGAAEIINRLCDPIIDPETRKLTGFTAKARLESTGIVETPVVQMSFGLMFLAHGRVPILVSKLRDEAFAWNNRPRDAAHLAYWIGHETEQRLSWQILNINAPLEEWFDGPMVYLSGHEAFAYVNEFETERKSRAGGSPPRFTTLERIKRYIDLGGLVVTNADGSNQRFTDAVQTLGRTMYPQYEWRPLPGDHYVYTLSAPVERPGGLIGLSNGVRELMIHCPQQDFGAALQVNDVNRRRDDFNMLGNVYYYASERGLTAPRLNRKLLLDESQVTRGVQPSNAGGLAAVKIARAVYNGNWNPEPGADELLALRLRAARAMDIAIVEAPLDSVDDSPAADAALLIVRGTAETEFTDLQAKALKAYVERGGTVLLENVGGISGFGRSAEEFVESFMPDGRFRRPTRHPVITGADIPNGHDCSSVSYRLFSLERFGGREPRPRLRALHEGSDSEKLRFFVSREDLSNALLGQPCWGVSGYTTADATELLGNLVEYGMQRRARK